MTWNGAGVYSRGYASWSNDAANNLPISATKFDLEDNDFAGGINNCLTKDGQNSPTAALTWTISNAAPLTLLRQTDGPILNIGRSSGTNNPVLQVSSVDGTGITLNLSTNQTLAFSVNGTSYVTLASTGFVVTGIDIVDSQPAIARVAALSTGTNGVTMSMRAYDAGPLGLIGTQSNHGIQIRTNDTSRITVDVNGAVVFNQASAGIGVTITAANGTQGLSVAGWSLNQGISISSGFAELLSSNTTASYIGTSASAGSGSLNICTASVARIQISSVGATQIGPASSGISLYVSAVSQTNVPAISVQGGSTAGQSNGVFIQAGNGNSADRVLDVLNYNGTARLFSVFGDGTVNLPNGSGTCTPAYAGVPINTQTGNYGCVLSDANKAIVMNAAGALFTNIPANSSVAYPVGTVITVYNFGAATNQISITSDTMYWAPSGATGTRNLSAKGIATLLKIAATSWVISGTGLS